MDRDDWFSISRNEEWAPRFTSSLESSMVALVLLPGMDGTGDLFDPLVAALSRQLNIVVVRYPVEVPLDYKNLIALVRDALPVDEDFVILGESFSGPIAVSLAAQAPRNLRGLILCASFVRSPLPWPAVWNALAAMLPVAAIPTGILSVPLLGRFGDARLRRSLARALSTVHGNVLRARIRSVLAVDVRRQAAAIAVPVLFIRASADWLIPKSAAQEIRELIPALQWVDLPGPHMLLQVSPEAAARVIEAFVDRVAGQSSKE